MHKTQLLPLTLSQAEPWYATNQDIFKKESSICHVMKGRLKAGLARLKIPYPTQIIDSQWWKEWNKKGKSPENAIYSFYFTLSSLII